uniref:Uncharacterized protein n=1 Tax=Lepeophtheirus salmonis TaxID=72036 RepID=A0A0K2THP2_LEPSM
MTLERYRRIFLRTLREVWCLQDHCLRSQKSPNRLREKRLCQ